MREECIYGFKILSLICILIIGSGTLIDAKEINVKTRSVFQKIQWGMDKNNLSFKKGIQVESDFIPFEFKIADSFVVYCGMYNLDFAFQYFDLNGKFLQLDNNDSDFIKKLNPQSYAGGNCIYLGNDEFNIFFGVREIGEPKDNSKLTILSVKRNNDTIKSKKIFKWVQPKGNNSYIENISTVTNNYIYFYLKGYLSCFDKKGKHVFESGENYSIIYVDGYDNVYIKENTNQVGVYNIQKRRGFLGLFPKYVFEKTAYFEVPEERGAEFSIDGGNVDSYLYQWEFEKMMNEDGSIIPPKTEYDRKIHIYQLTRKSPPFRKWEIEYKGTVTLGKCHFKYNSTAPGDHTIYNFIDAQNGLIQIKSDGSIYFGERDEKEYRIIKMTLDLK